MKKYYVDDKVCSYWVVYIIKGGYKEKVMVQEDNLSGFTKCLEYFGYKPIQESEIYRC